MTILLKLSKHPNNIHLGKIHQHAKKKKKKKKTFQSYVNLAKILKAPQNSHLGTIHQHAKRVQITTFLDHLKNLHPRFFPILFWQGYVRSRFG